MSRGEDLALGFRLAVGGGRNSVIRLVLSTIGIGLAVAILFVAASAGNAAVNRKQRSDASLAVHDPKPGVDPLFFRYQSTEFRGEPIKLAYLRSTGPNSPVLPGLTRVPSQGEVVVSPKLKELLASDAGTLLRPRIPGELVGVVGPEGLQNPNDMAAYLGADTSLAGLPVYGFGDSLPSKPLEPGVVMLLLIGLAALLTPVFIFIGTTSRIGGAERDRRLAALRLAGASSRQVRRVAAAETLASSATGLLAGACLFLVFRSQVANLQVFRFGVFPADLTPPWPLVVLIVLAVPVLTVVTTLAAQRHTIIEPLGVVRRTSPVRRRLWWRLIPVVVGIALLVPNVATGSELGRFMIMGGSFLLLTGVPALLPWLLERVVSRLRGGPPAFQLAIRRLQTDSGTPSRVVAGLCVVVAGAIALQSLLAGQTALYNRLTAERPPSSVPIQIDSRDGMSEEIVAALRAVPDTTEVKALRFMYAEWTGASVGVTDCATIKAVTEARACSDGDVFAIADERDAKVHNGQSLTLTDSAKRNHRWIIPVTPHVVEFKPGDLALNSGARILATPGAMTGVDLTEAGTAGTLRSTSADPDFVETVRNAMAPFAWRVQVYHPDGKIISIEARMFADARDVLFAGALFILLLAGVSLLVLAQEQVRERRRAIGALAATGVPVRVVMRSLLWQNGIPLLLGIGVATGIGVVIAAMGTRLLDSPLTVDWRGVSLLAGAAVAVVLLVTVSTWGSVRSAARLESLRTE